MKITKRDINKRNIEVDTEEDIEEIEVIEETAAVEAEEVVITKETIKTAKVAMLSTEISKYLNP